MGVALLKLLMEHGGGSRPVGPQAMPTHDPVFERNKPFAKSGQWQTALTPEQERTFRGWLQSNAHIPAVRYFNPDDPRSDYDMRGWWKAQQAGDPRAISGINSTDQQIHFPDVWKTPFHRSFSAESMYAQPHTPFHWKGENLIDSRTGKTIYPTMP